MVFSVPCEDRYGCKYTMEVVVPTKTFLYSEIDRYHGWKTCSPSKAKLIRKTKCRKIFYWNPSDKHYFPQWEEIRN